MLGGCSCEDMLVVRFLQWFWDGYDLLITFVVSCNPTLELRKTINDITFTMTSGIFDTSTPILDRQ